MGVACTGGDGVAAVAGHGQIASGLRSIQIAAQTSHDELSRTHQLERFACRQRRCIYGDGVTGHIALNGDGAVFIRVHQRDSDGIVARIILEDITFNVFVRRDGGDVACPDLDGVVGV